MAKYKGAKDRYNRTGNKKKRICLFSMISKRSTLVPLHPGFNYNSHQTKINRCHVVTAGAAKRGHLQLL